MSPGNQSNYFVHTLLRARDWQHRPQFDEVCAWWRGGGRGVCALVGMGGAGKTAIAERFLRVLPDVTEPERQLAKDSSLRTPIRLFVFSFYKDNEDRFLGELFAWLKGQPYDESARTPSLHQTLDLLKSAPCLLVLDGFEKVQDDGARGGVFGQITDRRLSDVVQRVALGLVPGVAALITTRFPIAELEEQRPAHFLPINVEEISDDAGMSLLKTRGVRGAKADLLRIVHDCGNHALTVDLAGGYIAEFAHGDPKTPLQLETTPKQAAEINAEPHPQRRYVMRQEHRFARVAERYREGFTERDPATLALLERACLFRLGVDAATLASIFTGKDKQKISGEQLARLSQQQLEQKLRLLTEMRLLEANEVSQRSTRYTIHPAVRDGFFSGIGRADRQASHEAVRKGLEVSLGDAPGENPSDPVILDLLEEIVHHTLQSGHVQEAWDIYWDRIGGYRNLGWRLGASERGERICRAFAGGQPPESLRSLSPEGEGQGEGEPDTEQATNPPYFALSENQQAIFINEWALYLQKLGPLDEATHLHELNIKMWSHQERWRNTSIGKQNLSELRLLTGRLQAAISDADGALRLADSIHDAQQRMMSYACRARARGLRGELTAAVHDFGQALYWQYAFDRRIPRPLVGPAGIWYATFLARAQEEEAASIVSTIKRYLVDKWGTEHFLISEAQLLLADLARERGDLTAARESLAKAHEWALARDAKESLCWSALVSARIELAAFRGQRPAEQDKSPFLESSRSILEDGLKIARDCGFGIYHIDLLLTRAQVALHEGRADQALHDVAIAIEQGIDPNAETGQPALLAATEPQCGYAWGEVQGRLLTGEALLLQSAQMLGRRDFVPANQPPREVRDHVDEAVDQLTRSANLANRIGVPRLTDAERVIHRVNKGVLTTYPLNLDDYLSEQIEHAIDLQVFGIAEAG